MSQDAGRVVIAGGSGFLGRHIAAELERSGYEVQILSRSAHRPNEILWDGNTFGSWVSALEGARAVINLAGMSVATRMTEPAKREILQSRRISTELVGQGILACARPPRLWLNASAVGYYGSQGEAELTEESPSGEDFFAEVARQWEAPIAAIQTPHTRRAWLRVGLVLGRDGGAFSALKMAATWFLGGPLGSGRQWMPWVHVDDVAGIARWCIESPAEGPYNVVSPNPARNAEFMELLRKVLRRPWAPPAPEFALRLLGKLIAPDPSLALISQRAVPKRLLEQGYAFRFPELEGALRDLVERKGGDASS